MDKEIIPAPDTAEQEDDMVKAVFYVMLGIFASVAVICVSVVVVVALLVL